jgi:hypothetical protein
MNQVYWKHQAELLKTQSMKTLKHKLAYALRFQAEYANGEFNNTHIAILRTEIASRIGKK